MTNRAATRAVLKLTPALALLIAFGAVTGCDNGDTQEDPVPTEEEPSSDEETSEDCDPSYPDSCIPTPPADLDCADVDEFDFTVEGDDPHGFDADGDGVGCESY